MMQRVPFWGWYLIITAGLYAVYNPLGYSIFHMWTHRDPLALMPWNILLSMTVIFPLLCVLWGVQRAMSVWGLAAMLLFLGACMWALLVVVPAVGVSLMFWSWIALPLVSVVLTVGWQWPRIWRQSTGVVTMDNPHST
tara:strand:+ start:9087 stop:9500 length:414 start_codon:yes stop_codon:yes gene_type:complete